MCWIVNYTIANTYIGYKKKKPKPTHSICSCPAHSTFCSTVSTSCFQFSCRQKGKARPLWVNLNILHKSPIHYTSIVAGGKLKKNLQKSYPHYINPIPFHLP